MNVTKAFYPFPTMFSKAFFSSLVKSQDCVVLGLKHPDLEHDVCYSLAICVSMYVCITSELYLTLCDTFIIITIF